MNRRRLLGALLVLFALPGFPIAATADTGPWQDAGDGRGPLAIRKIDIGHSRYDDTTVEITFERPVDPARLGKNDFFLVDYDYNGDRKSDHWVYFVPGRRGGWRSFTYYPQSGGVSYGTHPFRKTSPRSIKIEHWGSYDQDRKGGYLFRVVSYSEGAAGCAAGCWDFVPNANWLIHDWTPPRLVKFTAPQFSMTPTDEPTVPVKWRVTDIGFSGLKEQVLWKRLAGTDEWVKAGRSRSSALVRKNIPAEQGQKLELRLTSNDGAGNRLEPTHLQTVVPFDDSNAEHAATYVGLWELQERPDVFLKSLHVSTTPLDSFRFLGAGTRYCVSYRPGEEFGRARLEVAGERIDFDQSVPNPYGGRTQCVEHDTRSERTAVLTVQNGVINVDAFWFE